jgi:FAS-associated factor 2
VDHQVIRVGIDVIGEPGGNNNDKEYLFTSPLCHLFIVDKLVGCTIEDSHAFSAESVVALWNCHTMSAPDISQLSATQQEALQTYTAVTDQDPLAAIPILQRAEWNVQIAIARFFDGEPTFDPLEDARAALPSASTRQTTNLQYEALLSETRRSTSSRPPEDRVEKVDASAGTSQHQPSFLLSALLVPFNLVYRIFSTIFGPFGFLVPSFASRILSRLLTQQTRPTRRLLPPADNAARFIREFSEEHGEHSLPFVESGFNLTLDNAKKDLKFLVVTLLSPNHDDNNPWIRDTLLSEQMVTFFATHQDEVLLWGGNVQDPEAYQVSASLNCTKFPFVALICQNSDTGSTAMTVIMRAVGPSPPGDLVAKLSSAMTAQQSQLRTARAQVNEQQASRNLRQEQDSAYERSLAQDQERARRRREEQEAQEREEREAREAANAAEVRKQKIEQWRRWRAQSLSAEPEPDVKDTLRVSIRMPSGDRIIRKFAADAELEELYSFIECHDVVQEGAGPAVEEPSGYEHSFGFRLVSPMPRKVYELESGGTLAATIGKGANLIVEPIDDGEDE